jgi:L-iditol 2-dehydrogenase
VARLYGPGDVRLGDEPVPVPGAGQSLVRVTAVGLCGSDLHWYGEGGIGDSTLDSPLVVGHEFAGVVEGGPRHGQRVAVDPAVPCDACEQCRAGHRNLCPTVVFAGHGTCDGGLREYVAWPTALLYALPDGLSDAEGALLEPLCVALHALDLAHVRLGTRVAVVGCGPIGLMLVQAAWAAGAGHVLAADPLPHRLEAALRLGAGPLEGDADVVFEVAGTDAAVEAAMRVARPGARVVLIGIPDNDRTSFPASLARRKGLTLMLARRANEGYPRATELVRQKSVDLASLVTSRYPLDRVGEAFEDAEQRGGLKVILEPTPPVLTSAA